MRRRIIGGVMLMTLAVAATSRADDIDGKIHRAERANASAQARVHQIAADLATLQSEFDQVEARESAATNALITAYHRQMILHAHLAGARQLLNNRARAAYEVGPATALDVFLGAHDASDLASAQAYTERAFGSDADIINEVVRRQAEVEDNLGLVKIQQKALAKEHDRLTGIRTKIEAKLAEAESVASVAGGQLAALREEKHQMELAAARAAQRQNELDGAHDGSGGHWSGNADWDAIAACEAGGNWASNTGNGYWGGLQFAPGTWFSYGGGPFSGTGPFPYSRGEQIAVGERVLAGQGPGAWPSCFRSA